MARALVTALAMWLWVGCADALAWGCVGHQTVAIIAQRNLKPSVRQAVDAVLTASPITPGLKRGCLPIAPDPIVDAATWADDERAEQPATAPWHFVNMPRSLASATADPKPYCKNGNCIVDALSAQFQLLRTSSDPLQKARALRFVIHFAGDIHQPLHVVTNGDRGGNCFPVTYQGRVPTADDRGAFSPELHGVWDSGVITSIMKAHGLNSADALATYLASLAPFPKNVVASIPTAARVTTWARDTHALARSVAYGRLPVPVSMEPASAVTLSSCSDNHDVEHRMLALHEQLANQYEQAVEPVIVGQLRQAGLRLAAALAAAF